MRAGRLLTLRHVAPLSLAVLICMCAVGVSVVGANRQTYAPFTQAWILPDPSAGKNAMRVGLRSFERATMRYSAMLQVGTRTKRVWSPIELVPRARWQANVQLARVPAGTKATLLIYRLGRDRTPYRQVHLWLGG